MTVHCQCWKAAITSGSLGTEALESLRPWPGAASVLTRGGMQSQELCTRDEEGFLSTSSAGHKTQKFCFEVYVIAPESSISQ